MTPTFVKTCTWKPTGSSDIRAVTVNLQTSAFYDGAKQKATNDVYAKRAPDALQALELALAKQAAQAL